MRRAARIAAAVALLTPITAWAVDVSNDSITCNAVIASTISFSPGLVLGGSGTAARTVKVKGTVAGCVDTTQPGTKIKSGKFSAVLTGTTSNDCEGFLLNSVPLTGTMSIKWKADSTTPITPLSSTVTITAYAPAGAIGTPWSAAYLQFGLSSTGVTGAFTGGDAGASSSNALVISQDGDNALSQGCAATGGLKKLNIGLGQLILG